MTGTFTTSEKDRLFESLDSIQLDVRKLREGRIRDLGRISAVEKSVKAIEQRPITRRDRIERWALSLVAGGSLLFNVAAHIKF